ncbi:sugar nucleotide-binding protein [Megamonas funiformis]|uniref:sugar nucleotide-binding protein n=1 Tax=Megamonas funiformis TaxID=437897 RepID=UPI00265F18BB|nr:sugar nucleotide-binding protein [Megamonas funiformis]
MCNLALSDKYGVYHVINEGICSWYDFACEIFKQVCIKINVELVLSIAFSIKDTRSHNSKMSKNYLGEAGL